MADVAADLKTWSTTASSNSPSGGTAVGTGLDDNLREIQKVVRQDLATKGADIASAGTTDLGAVAGVMHDITGTTTITSFGTVSAGIWKIVKFEGVLTLTHNAATLILPGAANITTADGDIGIFISEGSGNWRCVTYFKSVGLYAPTVSPTFTGTPAAPTAAVSTNTTQLATTAFVIGQATTQAAQEAASSNTLFVTPGRQHFHPGASKAWCCGDFGGNIATSYNVSSVTDGGTGIVTVNFTTAMSVDNFAAVVSTQSGTGVTVSRITSKTTGGVRADFHNLSGVLVDVDAFNIVVFGDI